MEISYAVDIKCSPKVVFGWLEKPERAMAWMTSVSKTEILHETIERVGTTFREMVEEDGNAMEMRGVITGYEPDRSIAFHLNSRVNSVDVEYRVEETHDGVRLAEYAEVRWKFPVNIFSIILGDRMRQNIIAQLRGEFGKLKELCEGSAADARNI